ncbi:hypothetical protein D3C76_1404370 [compost metagenome]
MAHARRQRLQAIAHLAVCGQAVDDLHHFHQWHRIEEMETGDPLRVATVSRDAGHRQRRGVGCQHTVVSHYGFEFGQQRLLGIQALDDGFDGQVDVLEFGQ